MKHISFLYNDKQAYKQAKKEFTKAKYKSKLIQFFCGNISLEKIEKKLHKLHKDFPDAIIVGATTAGEISHGKMYENEDVVSLSLFKKTKLKAVYKEEINHQSAHATAKALCTKETKAMVVLSEGLYGEDYESYLHGIKELHPNIILSGGLAGDNFALKETFVFFGTQVYKKGVVAVSFSGKKLFASNKYNLNWIPIGKEFRVTEVEHNIVKKIDDIPAVDFFKKYLGEEVIKKNDVVLPNFQLLFHEGSTTVARTPLAIEGKSFVFAAPLQQGQKVQFGFSNESMVIDGALALQDALGKYPAEAIYIFSCIARKTLLGKVLEKEFGSFEKIAPTTGFFTYGEFYSTDAKDVLLNCTTTVLVLSESKKIKKIHTQTAKQRTLDTITFDVLSHFIKQTSKELHLNNKLMNQYKDAVDASLIVSKTDTKGYITYVNDNFCAISKYKEEELLGQNHNIVRDPEVSSFTFQKMWQTIQSKKVWKGKFSNKAKDGTIYYVDATIMPIFDEAGEIEEYIAIRQDVTKQVLANKRMREKEKLIRAIFDNQDSIVIQTTKTEGMLDVNKKLFDYFDYKSFDDFKSKHQCICDLFLDEEGYVNPKKYPNWLDDIASDENHDYKVKMRTKTGAVHTFTIKIKKIDNEYIINLYDITKLERALLKAYSSERAKATFLANMSHEIRTPLNGILGFTDLLVKKDLDKDTKRYIDIIHKSGQTLLNVVNDILDFSKLESGELNLYETEANLFEEMEVAVSTFASVAKKKKINYYVYIDTNIPKKLKCDVQRLKQVINNLISNAIKFTPQNGEVRVRIELKKLQDKHATLHFSVQDSGIGIAADKMKTIFEAFSQADNSISREFGGTGLGLAISNQYINMMGSQIEVRSEESKGSEFFFDVTFEVLDERASLQQKLDISSVNIVIMNTYNGVACEMNKIVYTYLDAWNCGYKEVDTLEAIDASVDILIVCSKLFDKATCEETLQRFEHLQLIYIEGVEDTFSCEHKRFYRIEQPMTGSVLFDKLISLMDTSINEYSQQSLQEQNTQHLYDGDVLVAEDNETNQMLIAIFLDERGLRYKIVANGQEAVDELLHKEYDLTFMDINMPVLDGIGATKILRENGYTKPIVSLSANVIESDTKAFREAGMDDTLNKPIIPQELDAILEKYLSSCTPQEEDIFEIPSIDEIAQNLMLEDAVVKKLLGSLVQTFEETLKELEDGKLTKEILHKIKGVSGNMRFTQLYTYCGDLEDKFEELAEQERKQIAQKLHHHLQHAVQMIYKSIR